MAAPNSACHTRQGNDAKISKTPNTINTTPKTHGVKNLSRICIPSHASDVCSLPATGASMQFLNCTDSSIRGIIKAKIR